MFTGNLNAIHKPVIETSVVVAFGRNNARGNLITFANRCFINRNREQGLCRSKHIHIHIIRDATTGGRGGGHVISNDTGGSRGNCHGESGASAQNIRCGSGTSPRVGDVLTSQALVVGVHRNHITGADIIFGALHLEVATELIDGKVSRSGTTGSGRSD